MTVTAIVLAGGRSSRYGAPKLAQQIDGVSMLSQTIGSISNVADEIVVAGPDLPPELGASDSIRLIPDHELFGGPLPALAGALGSARGALALVVGGDMPWLVPAVLRSMLDRLATDRAIDAVLLEAPNGAAGPVHRQVLPLALRVAAARPVAAAAASGADRSIRALVDRLRAAEVPMATWLTLDPDRLTLRDVDTPSDLERTRGEDSGDERRPDLR